MYLTNNLKWHSTALFNFMSFIKLHQSHKQRVVGNDFGMSSTAPEKSMLQCRPNQASHTLLGSIHLEISIEKINELIKHKQICAVDIRCLDVDSKRCLTKLFLQNCLTRM